MIGNDIVDLQYVSENSDWERPGFLDKVCSEDEQTLIFASKDNAQTVWLLWSMKEAAYKVYVQEFGRRFFNPKAFRCELDSLENGKVFYEQLSYVTKSNCTQDYIFTTATKSYNDEVFNSVSQMSESIYSYQSKIIRQNLLGYVSQMESIDQSELKIIKNENGVPRCFRKSEQLPIWFSLTHCGNYGGFSVLNH